jgi:hypothetical protein
MTEKERAADDRRVEILHISEADFQSLPRSVRMLMRDYSRPVASGQDGLMVLELHSYRWPEIESEIKSVATQIRTTQGLGKLTKTVRYANDYECPKDGAAWSRVGCASARKERCPMCHGRVKPIAVERYVVLEWTRPLPNPLSRFGELVANVLNSRSVGIRRRKPK